eukprot:345195-Chlamydomonas_euryale.AAC.3
MCVLDGWMDGCEPRVPCATGHVMRLTDEAELCVEEGVVVVLHSCGHRHCVCGTQLATLPNPCLPTSTRPARMRAHAHADPSRPTQAQAAARADQLRQLAQFELRRLGAAQEKPRLSLSLSCHAPKVAVPDATGRCSLLLDLGLFTLKSVRAADAALSGEEAALFECFSLGVGSVAAYLHEGPERFAWPTAATAATAVAAAVGRGGEWDLLALVGGGARDAVEASAAGGGGGGATQRGRLVPLLERFAVNVDLQLATSVHPRLPQARVQLATSPLQLHFSPALYYRLMSVVAAATAAPDGAARGDGEDDERGGGAGVAKQPLWLTDAEHRTRGKLLVWEGVARQSAAWRERWLTVWRGQLVLSTDTDEVIARPCVCWGGRGGDLGLAGARSLYVCMCACICACMYPLAEKKDWPFFSQKTSRTGA